MSAGKISNLRAALTKSFVDASLFDESKVQWENKEFKQPTSGNWAAVWFVPNEPSVATLGPTGSDDCDGFFQIDLNYPVGNGTAAIEAMAESIRNVFKAGSHHSYSGDTATIRSCGRNTGQIVNSFYKVVITIYFYSRINRS